MVVCKFVYFLLLVLMEIWSRSNYATGGYNVDKLLDPRVFQSRVKGYSIEPKGSSLYLVNVLVYVRWEEGNVGGMAWAKPHTLEKAALKLHISTNAVGTLLRWYLDASAEVMDEKVFQTWREGSCESDEEQDDGNLSSTYDSTRISSTDSASSISFALQALKLQVHQYCSSGSSNSSFLRNLSAELKSFALETDPHSGGSSQCFHPLVKKRPKTARWWLLESRLLQHVIAFVIVSDSPPLLRASLPCTSPHPLKCTLNSWTCSLV